MNLFYKSKIILGLEIIRRYLDNQKCIGMLIFSNFKNLVYSYNSNNQLKKFNELLNIFEHSYNKGSVDLLIDNQQEHIIRNNQRLFDTLILNFNSIQFTDEDTSILKEIAMYFNDRVENTYESIISDMKTLLKDILKISSETQEMNVIQNESLSKINELCENMYEKFE